MLVLWSLFAGWYTSCDGPLDDDEIAAFMDLARRREPALPPEALDRLRRFMEEDTGDDFVMVNVIELYDTPLVIEGVRPGESSQEVLDKYMAYMLPALLSRGSHPVIFGAAASNAMDLMNADGMERWTTGAGMRYRSRRDFLEIAIDPAFADAHEFKKAAMRKTIAFPIDPWIQLGDPRLVLGLFFIAIGFGLSWNEARRRAPSSI